MASCAAGFYAGPAKQARLGLVRLKAKRHTFNEIGYAPMSAVMDAFDIIVIHSGGSANTRGRAILGMSFGVDVGPLWWPLPTVPTNDGRLHGTDVFGNKLVEVYEVGIAVAASAGNQAERAAPENDISYRTPQRNGGANSPLIVVGNSNLDNTRYTTSIYVDSSGLGILSIYAVGVDCVCGNYEFADPTNLQGFALLTDTFNGNSQATAQTVGVIANMLMDPAKQAQLVAGGLSNFAMAVKTELLRIAVANKDLKFPDGIPRLSNDISIPCPGPAVPRPLPYSLPQAPPLQQGLVPIYQEIASGDTVVVNGPVSCCPHSRNLTRLSSQSMLIDSLTSHLAARCKLSSCRCGL